MVLAQRLGGVADFALAGQEHEHVARTFAAQFVDGVDNGFHQISIGFALGFRPLAARRGRRRVTFRGLHGGTVFRDGPVAHLDRIQPAAHLDHRRGLFVTAEVARETVRVDRRRGHDQLQIGTLDENFLQIAKQEVDVEAALVRLVDDQGVVRFQQRIGLRFGKQDTVGHQLDGGARRQIVGKAHLVADHFAERRAEFFGDAAARRRCGDAARLRVADQPGAARTESAAQFEADLRQLGRFPRTRFAADDHDLIVGDRLGDFFAAPRHGQRFRVSNRWNRIRFDDSRRARRTVLARFA